MGKKDKRTKIEKFGDAINTLNVVPSAMYDTLIGQHVRSIKNTRTAIKNSKSGHSDLRKRGLFNKKFKKPKYLP
jgi:hypothetical protein